MEKQTENQEIKQKLIDDLQDKYNNIRFAKEAFLRKYGWDNSCKFPDCCWRWVKEIKGQTIAVSLNDAIDLESEIVEYQ